MSDNTSGDNTFGVLKSMQAFYDKLKTAEPTSEPMTVELYVEYMNILELVKNTPPVNPSNEKMIETIWKRLDKYATYDRGAMPADHDPSVIYNMVKIQPFIVLFSNMDPVDLLFAGYFLRSFKQMDAALTAYRISAKAGNVDALIGMGSILETQDEPDFELIEGLYHEALVKGKPRALGNLGQMFLNKGDPREAFVYFMEGAKLDDPICVCMATSMLRSKEYPDIYDPVRGEEMLNRGCDLEVPMLLFQKAHDLLVRVKYEESLLLEPEDTDKIAVPLEMLEKAASLGFSYAMDSLISIYLSIGKRERSYYWMEKLIEKGDQVARNFLTYLAKKSPELAKAFEGSIKSMPDYNLSYVEVDTRD